MTPLKSDASWSSVQSRLVESAVALLDPGADEVAVGCGVSISMASSLRVVVGVDTFCVAPLARFLGGIVSFGNRHGYAEC